LLQTDEQKKKQGRMIERMLLLEKNEIWMLWPHRHMPSSFVLLWVWKTVVGDHRSFFIVSCGRKES
jgi:hypothetical protein